MSMINIFRDYFGKDRLLQAVQVEARDSYEEQQRSATDTASVVAESEAYAAHRRLAPGVIYNASRPVWRPGDEQPHPYIDNARERLTSTRDTYTKELDALVKDIAKLEEERRQLEIAIKGVDAALSVVGEETEPTIDEELMAAEIDRDIFHHAV